MGKGGWDRTVVEEWRSGGLLMASLPGTGGGLGVPGWISQSACAVVGDQPPRWPWEVTGWTCCFFNVYFGLSY